MQLSSVIPVKAGICRFTVRTVDSCFRRNDRQFGKVAHGVISVSFRLFISSPLKSA
jgi:hypothetical protein